MNPTSILDNEFQTHPVSFVLLIRKYALLILIFLSIEVAVSLLSTYMITVVETMFSLTYSAYFRMILFFPGYILNLIISIILYKDMKRTGNISKTILVLTLLYSEIGVCFFMFTLLHSQAVKARGN